MNRIHIASFFLVFSSLQGENNPILDSLTSVLRDPAGVKMALTISQNQYDDSYVDYATLEIVNQHRYIFLSPAQIIRVNDQTVYTFTPESHQVVIDRLFPKEFSLFTLLTGDFSHLDILKVIPSTDGTQLIEFFIHEIELSGTLKIDEVFHPEKIHLNYDKDNTIDVDITSFNHLRQPSDILWAIDGWEVIDLRE